MSVPTHPSREIHSSVAQCGGQRLSSGLLGVNLSPLFRSRFPGEPALGTALDRQPIGMCLEYCSLSGFPILGWFSSFVNKEEEISLHLQPAWRSPGTLRSDPLLSRDWFAVMLLHYSSQRMHIASLRLHRAVGERAI